MRGLLIVININLLIDDFRRTPVYTAARVKGQIISPAFAVYTKAFTRRREWSNPAPNNCLKTAIKDVVNYPRLQLKFLTYSKVYKRRPGQIHWSGDGWLRTITGAGALQNIDRAVERFLKNKMSLTDGMELLCQMKQVTCSMLLLQDQRVRRSKELAVRQYLSAMSN